MKFVRLAGRGMEKLDGRIEGQNDFKCPCAFFRNLAMNRMDGVLASFEPATRKKETELFRDACHVRLLVENDRVCRRAQPISAVVLPVAKASDARHLEAA